MTRLIGKEMAKNYGRIDGCALVPDQLTHYVKAISGMEARLINGFPFYADSGMGILVTFTGDSKNSVELEQAIEDALRTPQLKTLTVLGDEIPQNAPKTAKISQDDYWVLKLPAAPSSKTRNMIKNAARNARVEVSSGPGAIGAAHEGLVREFCENKKDQLDEATKFIFTHLAPYVASSSNVKVFSAFARDRLAGFVIGDFTSFENAFYMFAFRSPSAPPGIADLLLHSLATEAEDLGFLKINLGLGINKGIEFFKRKWGAEKYFPYVETTWDVPGKQGLFARIANSFFRGQISDKKS